MQPEIQTLDLDDRQDVMGPGAVRWHYPIGKHGFCDLVDAMPRFCPAGRTADFAVVQAARVSMGQGLKTPQEDETLIRYLMRHRHTSPFEMVEFKFHMAMPIFVARQFIRHRTANVNEFSGRYSEMPDTYWMPEKWRGQDPHNKQASEGEVAYQPIEYLFPLCGSMTAEQTAFFEYQTRLKQGISREMARTCLPLSVYTQWYWKCDLHNILHFLSLRMNAHAQPEIRDYAEAMYHALCQIVPITMKAFKDYRLDAVTLTGPEVEMIQAGGLADGQAIRMGAREKLEWKAKLEKLRSLPGSSENASLAQPAKD